MNRPLILVCVVIGSLFLSPLATLFATEIEHACETMLPLMQETLAAARLDIPRTPEQEDLWRTWNITCRAAEWQHRLAALGPPAAPFHAVIEDTTPLPSIVAPIGLTWRDYVLAFLRGFEQGATGDLTIYTSTYRTPRHTYQSRTTCITSTYASSCSTTTR